MDEIDWIKQTKKAIRFITKIIMIMIGIVLLLTIIPILNNETEAIINFIMFAAMGVGMIIFILLAYGAFYIAYKILYGSNKNVIIKEEYLREIAVEYSPRISSLVYDLKVDVYKDYTATILHLYNKGYINIFEKNKISKIEIKKEKDSSILQEHEKYVLECLAKEKKFDDNRFKEILIRDAQRRNLLTTEKQGKTLKILLLIVMAIIFLITSYFINKILFGIVFTIIFSIVYTFGMLMFLKREKSIETIVDTSYKRTKKGEQLSRNLTALKKFLNEYTLIKDRSIEHVQVLNEYIPYAIALGEAKNIEEYIKSNSAYRKLIYNK